MLSSPLVDGLVQSGELRPDDAIAVTGEVVRRR
jgi:polyhydroxyalkanoate synthesis regulator phasin